MAFHDDHNFKRGVCKYKPCNPKVKENIQLRSIK
jgi:hypothetical protein